VVGGKTTATGEIRGASIADGYRRRHTMMPRLLACALLAASAICAARPVDAQHAIRQATDGRPDAVVDLRTDEGVALVRGQ
jgi:hypothetical protein